MSRFVRRVLIIALLILAPALLFGTACTSNPHDVLPEVLPGADSITSPVVISYLVKNPLENIPAEVTEGANYKRTMTIKGLSNKEIQTSINNALEEIYVTVLEADLPPYRGIRQKISSNSVIYNSNLNASMSFSYNNVGSIMIHGNRAYVEQDVNGSTIQKSENPNDIINVGIMEAYNVDLNTGEQISLKDVFADDVDYKTILNDYIASLLLKSNATEEEDDYFSMGGNLKLVSPFKGISDNQKFFLYQGGLALIFDYSNPEFDTNLYPSTIHINFKELGNVVAVTERFYDTNSDLYESDAAPVYEFPQAWNGNDVTEQNNELDGNVNIYQTLRYNKDIPKSAREKVKSLYLIDEKRLDEIKKLTDPTLEMFNSFEQYVWTNVAGEYITVTRNTSMSYNGQWKAESENYCYDAAGNEIGLKDIFAPDYDYKSIIMKGLINALNQMPTEGNYDVNQLYNELQFSIGLSEISFTTNPVKFDDTSENSVYFSLTFEEIGCNNLVIFN